MDKNRIVLLLHEAWKKRNNAASSSGEDLPESILRIEDVRVRRLYIFFYFTICTHPDAHLLLMSNIRALESLPPPESPPPSAWEAPSGVLNPAHILGTPLSKLSKVLAKSYSLQVMQKLHVVSKYVCEHGEIPRTLSDLLRLKCISEFHAHRVMHHAWGECAGIPPANTIVRTMFRLGWLEERFSSSGKRANMRMSGERARAVQKSMENAFSQKLWKFITPSFNYHGYTVCKEADPQCDRCMLNSVCPSSSAPSKYMVPLKYPEEEYDLSDMEQESSRESACSLMSESLTEEEDMSDVRGG
ncbi:uncharacterized protein NEMAJ01_0589 [Nematocida major]|uniref:uncharacterized protein n=1 Tax=Nematocida major TaxID=1912982 RepID=UPI00200877EB|nr:uncharacterized protein NEMAJ01_0589 [Nematocida major]KAH9385693.1 hypothetical protein NEMAJ01_0589 [Nematocida major]